MKFVWGIIIASVVLLVAAYSYGSNYARESEMYHFCKNVLKKNLKDSTSLIIDEVIVAAPGGAQEYPPEILLKSGYFKSTKPSVAIKYSAKNSYGAYGKDFTICEFSADINKSNGKYTTISADSIYVGRKKIIKSSKSANDILSWQSFTGNSTGYIKEFSLSPIVATYDLLIDKANFIKPEK